MGFSRFWLNMAVKEIKVHRRVIRMIFPMIQRVKNDRSVQRELPVYDNGHKPNFIRQVETAPMTTTPMTTNSVLPWSFHSTVVEIISRSKKHIEARCVPLLKISKLLNFS